MKINYDLSKQDFDNFLTHHTYKTKNKVRRVLQKTLQVFIFALLIFSILHLQLKVNIYVSSIIGLVFGLILIKTINKTIVSSMIKTSNSLGKKQTIEISPRGIEVDKITMRTTINWDAIIEIANDENGVYFYTNPQCAFIIPRKSFNNEAGFNEFINLSNFYKKDYLATES